MGPGFAAGCEAAALLLINPQQSSAVSVSVSIDAGFGPGSETQAGVSNAINYKRNENKSNAPN